MTQGPPVVDLVLLLILIHPTGDPSPELSGNLQPHLLIYGLGMVEPGAQEMTLPPG